MPTFIAIAAVMTPALVSPRMPSVPKYFLAIAPFSVRYRSKLGRLIARQTGKGEHEPGVADFGGAGGRPVAWHRTRQMGAQCRRGRVVVHQADRRGVAARAADGDRAA